MKDCAEIIKDKISITDILKHYNIEIKRGGFISCPLHLDKTPSAKVYLNQNKIKCFSCGENLDVISIVEKMQNTDFKGATSYLDNQFGLELNKPLTDKQKKEWVMQKKEKEKRQIKARNFDLYERKVFDRLIVEIRTSEATVCQCKPKTTNYMAYAETKSYKDYLSAIFRLKYLEWLFGILQEDSNTYLHNDYIEYTYQYGYKKRDILILIYKGVIKL